MQYSDEEERGYPWFFFHASQPWVRSTLISLIILAACVGFFIWATRVSDDQGGDSFAGLVLAVVGTSFMIMAAVGFTLRRQARKRYVGQLKSWRSSSHRCVQRWKKRHCHRWISTRKEQKLGH